MNETEVIWSCRKEQKTHINKINYTHRELTEQEHRISVTCDHTAHNEVDEFKYSLSEA